MLNFNVLTRSKALAICALFAFSLVSAAQSAPKRNAVPQAVTAFYADHVHCSDMAAVPETQSDAEATRFTADIGKAVDALRSTTPGLTRDKALMVLKAGCDKRLQADAGVPLDGSKTKRKQ